MSAGAHLRVWALRPFRLSPGMRPWLPVAVATVLLLAYLAVRLIVPDWHYQHRWVVGPVASLVVVATGLAVAWTMRLSIPFHGRALLFPAAVPLMLGLFAPAAWEADRMAATVPIPAGGERVGDVSGAALLGCQHPCTLQFSYTYPTDMADRGAIRSQLLAGWLAAGWRLETLEGFGEASGRDTPCWFECVLKARRGDATVTATLERERLDLALRLA